MTESAKIIVKVHYRMLRKKTKRNYTYTWVGPDDGIVYVSGTYMRELRHDWMKLLPWPMEIVSHDKRCDQWFIRRKVIE